VKKAVVLLSGGLDSATTLAIACRQHYECYALSVDYGQRQKSELFAAQAVARSLGVYQHRVIKIGLAEIAESALTDPTIAVPINGEKGVIPVTYVPARNTVMLSLALAWAETLGCYDIFIGVNAIDYSGYPDCRPEYIEAFDKMANLATKSAIEGKKIMIQAPLINWSKEKIIQKGMALGVNYSLTVSCYQADDAGLACGVCDACRLRRDGFYNAGINDPTRYKII
jgi:7-cyano-7-deazaguanine synthase